MATLTRNALLEIEREKDFTPEEAVAFLHKRENFMSMSVGLKRELHKREDCPADEKQLLPYFKEVLKSAGFTKDQRKNADVWLIQGKLPTPHYAIRLCFAFGLTGQDALTFLWNCCKVNGFNFRRAEDVVYCYCLENGKSYDDAKTIIKRYNQQTADLTFEIGDATKRTQTLRRVFHSLTGTDETAFFDKLCLNKKNFIGYSRTANEQYVQLHERLIATIQADIDSFNSETHSGRINKDAYKAIKMEGYNGNAKVYPEIVYALSKIAITKGVTDKVAAGLFDNFPRTEYLNEMLSTMEAATDKEHDKSRKVFMLLYFAEYAIYPPSDEFFGDFVIALNTALDSCGYAKLYPANPYDWLILNCVRSIDFVPYADDNADALNPIECFNEVLLMLVN
ncbi:hypothetical protein FACS1894202_07180 [Clostridia bacterium]|nr:hypothetical protein FACS1894202_07180 [Clostridia bacterium]